MHHPPTQKSTPRDVDFIEELRLRRWARLHFTPIEQRKDEWHPIILDEMIRKDHDMQPVLEPVRSTIVPVLDSRERRLDQPHGLPDMHIHHGSPVARSLQTTDEMYYM